jgi:hypothetical protein
MYFVFKEDGRCDAREEALFLVGMKRDGYKDVRLTAAMFLLFGLFYRLVAWLIERGKPFLKLQKES